MSRTTFAVLGLAVMVAVAAPAVVRADDDAPLALLDLALTGPAYDFGVWLLDALEDEDLQVRWPDFDEAGDLDAPPDCVVTWSDPSRGGLWTKRMRKHLSEGGGMIYIVGTGSRNLRAARDFWSWLDIDIEAADGEAGFARWGRHPLTEGLPNIGAVDPGAYISSAGGSPLIKFGGDALAMAFDWGEQGRGVIVDQGVLGDQLNSAQPRPALRELLIRCARWTAGAKPLGDQDTPDAPDTPATRDTDAPDLWHPEPVAIGAMASDRVLMDIAADDQEWPLISQRVVSALEAADLRVRMADAREGQPRLTDESLAGVGMVVIGAARDDFTWSEGLALRRFVDAGGRVLLLAREQKKPHARMVSFNGLLDELELAASLGRRRGKVELHPHEITKGVGGRSVLRSENIVAGPGARIWAWQAAPIISVSGAVAAAAVQTETSRVFIMDAGLLLPWQQRDPADSIFEVLSNAVKWLAGE